jgi:RsiW-degrading membrane proteinase PrsW (M82 family)
MNRKFFVLALIYWIAVAVILVVLFNFYPRLAESKWTFAGVVLLSLLTVIVVKRLSASRK